MGWSRRAAQAQVRLIWTEPALRDLGAARLYIATDNLSAAHRQIGMVRAAIARLPDFPESGRPGRRPGTRELVVTGTPFVVPYRVRGDAIAILRVLHGARRWPDRL